MSYVIITGLFSRVSSHSYDDPVAGVQSRKKGKVKITDIYYNVGVDKCWGVTACSTWHLRC